MTTLSIVMGAGGFIGNHMVNRLKLESQLVIGVDLKDPEYQKSNADVFMKGDLRNASFVDEVFDCARNMMSAVYAVDVYQFAADMGGAGFVFSGEHDAEIMHNSALVNLHTLEAFRFFTKEFGKHQTKIFYSSSACMYPEYNQLDPNNPKCSEDSAYPAAPDSEYGWEKLFSERLYDSYRRNFGLSIAVARYHNIYGPLGTWTGGREKAPAAICRKVALLPDSGGEIEVWGDGQQTRSFLFIDECIEATRRLMKSDYFSPVNIGSEEMVTINQLVEVVAKIANKSVSRKHILDAPIGVRGRNSDNTLARKVLDWDYRMSLEEGLTQTYKWISNQISSSESRM